MRHAAALLPPALATAALMAALAWPVAGPAQPMAAPPAAAPIADPPIAAPPIADPPIADPWATSFRPMPFHRIAEAVTDRYDGRLIAAQTRPPRAPERALGAELIYEFRLLTPARNMLNIRLDARTGRFLDVSGRGQVAARKGAGSRTPPAALPPAEPGD